MAFFKSLEYVLDVYLLLKFEEMSVKVLLKSLVSIIYAKLFEAIFLEPRKKKKKKNETLLHHSTSTRKS